MDLAVAREPRILDLMNRDGHVTRIRVSGFGFHISGSGCKVASSVGPKSDLPVSRQFRILDLMHRDGHVARIRLQHLVPFPCESWVELSRRGSHGRRAPFGPCMSHRCATADASTYRATSPASTSSTLCPPPARVKGLSSRETCGSEEGSYLRLIDFFITQL